jgi:signal transduction histidine kinase
MLPYPWRLSIGIARASLGICCLALDVIWARSPFAWVALPMLAVIAYALVVVRRGMETDGAPRTTLAIDLAWYALWLPFAARAGYPDLVWVTVALAFAVFLLATAILNQPWIHVLAVCAVVLLSSILVPAANRARIFWPLLWCVALGAVWVLNRAHLNTRLSRASRHGVVYRFEARQAREDERSRIAADFHDGPLQSFIGLQMRLEVLKKLMARNPATALEEIAQLQELCRSQVDELRSFVRGMRPADIVGSSLGASISRIAEQFQKDTGISTSFTSGEYVEPSEGESSIELLQVVREALNNVRKHSHASRVDVSLNRSGNAIEIAVRDNGEGFPFSGAYTLDELDLLRMGPVSIRRRVRAVHGEMTLDSRPGGGAGLKIRVPAS